MKGRETVGRSFGSMMVFISALVLFLLMGALSARAAAKVKSVEYEGKGKVEVSFKTPVKYKKLKVQVKNASGKTVKASISGHDSDDVTFRLKKYTAGKVYSFTISGVARKTEKKFTSVKGKFMIPKTGGAVTVKEIEYDPKDRELEFSFQTAVEWKNVSVKIFDGEKSYSAVIREKDRKELELRVKGLKKGSTYQFTISGIRKKGASEYGTVSGSFMA